MSNNFKYPKVGIRSKNELAKRISGNGLTYKAALSLINDCVQNFNLYWRDSKTSDLTKEKFVRSTVGTPLARLLRLINEKVLQVADNKLPDYIFGGIRGKNHIAGAGSLIGKKTQRTLLKLDIKRFFEQVSEERIYYFFKKCGCADKGAKILAELCCVPRGAKNSNSKSKVLARGFATSPRLATWCNIEIFQKVFWKVKRRLGRHDPELMIFFDDIGITASGLSEEMELLSDEIKKVLADSDPNQSLPISHEKLSIKKFDEGTEIVGLRLGKKVSVGKKTRSKIDKLKYSIKKNGRTKRKTQKLKGYINYQNMIKNQNNGK